MSRRNNHSACFPDDIRLARVCVVMAGLILAACVAPSLADTIVVTTDSGGTGGPDCTLRDAITAANTDTATGGCQAGNGADTIELPSASIITLTESSFLLSEPGNFFLFFVLDLRYSVLRNGGII